ncbi:hypothetical protein MNR02_06830 [Shinella sp. H4-D48]|uniref:Uncharacterized protein n=1 Tax=Shinella sedimenti TaxID=2919913 RepID=A0ABT0CK98_9HYPH|nr:MULTISPECIES: hypothetical protein [Shinella]MCJ8148689.1 hypothetical protein [Shinella sedimenti]UNK39417.1 hypothetical protein MNR02_06830 [Shinella sp. H4-D48]
MTSRQLLILTLSLVLASPALADSYSAISNTAMSITGDIEFDDFGITFENGKKITFDQLVGDTFVVGGETVNASVYSVADPEDPVLLNGNRLCGEPVTYVASWGDASTTTVAVFSTQDVPSSDADMCASYTYE